MNIGTLVKLKSGGPVMTITFLFNNGKAACMFFDGPVQHEVTIHTDALVEIEEWKFALSQTPNASLV